MRDQSHTRFPVLKEEIYDNYLIRRLSMNYFEQITKENHCYYQSIIDNNINFNSTLSCKLWKMERELVKEATRSSSNYIYLHHISLEIKPKLSWYYPVAQIVIHNVESE
jgi:hypothetical protein